METLSPGLYFSEPNCSVQHQSFTRWTKEENKQFESALAVYDEGTPDRWLKIAARVPGKTMFDVMKQYQELEKDVYDIESGMVPLPGYLNGSFSLEELVESHGFDEFRKKSSVGHERKKGVPWTEAEHRRFLLGLLEHGRGDWRNISRNFVISKTPTQVASHAQKYFQRQDNKQASGGKDKKRPSIHDITTVNLMDRTNLTPSSDAGKPLSPHPLVVLPQQQNSQVLPNTAHPNMFVPSQC